MVIGPGLQAWITAHQATPLSDEFGWGSPWQISGVWIEIANAAGQKTHSWVGWDHQLSAIIEPGPGPVIPPSTLPLMYDSTMAADIPATAQLVAGYLDGAVSKWNGDPYARTGDWARFPHYITITVTGGNVADVCDCETGDLTPDMAAAWIQTFPGNVVYCNLSTAPAVQAAMQAAGLTQYSLWIADWTGVPHMASVPGSDVVATQYADPGTGSGGHFDLSVITQELWDRYVV